MRALFENIGTDADEVLAAEYPKATAGIVLNAALDDHNIQKKFLEDLYAFLDSNPVDLTDEERQAYK